MRYGKEWAGGTESVYIDGIAKTDGDTHVLVRDELDRRFRCQDPI